MKTRTLHRWLAVAALAAAPMMAGAYSKVVIFGDSLSDGGNNAALFGTDPDQVITGNGYSATLPYGSGTYSDGQVWGHYLGQLLGQPITPSLTGGTNFAFGGARTRGSSTPSLLEQVGMYLGTDTSAASDTLFIIAGGGNNARDALEAIAGGAPIARTLLGTSLGYARDVGLMVDQLQAVGAQDFIVWNTPDLGLVPQVTVEGQLAATLGTVVSNAFSAALARRMSFEDGVTTFDVAGLLRTVVGNPSDFGLENVTDACGALPDCDTDTFLFWDGIHPTTAGQKLIAERLFALTSPVPEPGTWALLAGGLGVLAWRRRQVGAASAGAASSRATSPSSL